MALAEQLHQVEESDRETLTLPVAKRALINSFYISQGDPGTQRSIFLALHEIRPHWKVDDVLKQQLIDAGISTASIILFPGGEKTFHRSISREPLDPSSSHFSLIAEEIKKRTNQMQEIFNSKKEEEEDNQDLHFILNGIIKKDHVNLCERGGRQRSKNEGQYDPRMDPFLSHLCYYGIEANSTGMVEFDLIFKYITQIYETRLYQKNSQMKSLMDEAIFLYVIKHPEKKEFYREKGLIK